MRTRLFRVARAGPVAYDDTMWVTAVLHYIIKY